MPTSFSLTLDSVWGSLVLVAGEEIVHDVTAVRITKSETGSGFDCEVTRAGVGAPVRLVASASPEGRLALERANGQESVSVPGFVELTTPFASVQDDITRYLSR
jgi:hypothetical protein